MARIGPAGTAIDQLADFTGQRRRRQASCRLAFDKLFRDDGRLIRRARANLRI